MLDHDRLWSFDLRELPDRVACHFKYGPDLESLWS